MTFIRVGVYIFGGYTDRDWRKYSLISSNEPLLTAAGLNISHPTKHCILGAR